MFVPLTAARKLLGRQPHRGGRIGHRILIVQSASDGPTHLNASETVQQLRFASDFLGMDAFETEDQIPARTEY